MKQATFLTTASDFRAADISPCGKYRYSLERRWTPGPLVNWIMLNPSVADANDDDPTIRRCVGFAKSWGGRAIVVTNLFAMRSTDPAQLWHDDDPIGPLNDAAIREHARDAALVVCAWGNDGLKRGRAENVVKMLRDFGVTLYAIKITGLRQPSHPLYLKADLSPFVWSTP